MPITTTPYGNTQAEISTYTPIYAQTVPAGGAGSITFSNIPATFTDLVLIIKCPTISLNHNLRFNGDTGINYSYTGLYGDGTSATSSRSTSNTVIGLTYTSSGAPMSRIYIQNYTSTVMNKTVLIRQDDAANATSIVSGLWRNTAAINIITITSTGIPADSTFTLYGIKATPPVPKATGGDIIANDGTYWYHAFTSSGTFTPKATLSSLGVLVVAGGGGSARGPNSNGGGGAGGYSLLSTSGANGTDYSILVGGGGAGRVGVTSGVGTNGSNSAFSSTPVNGGGGGAYSAAGASGRSGGGSSTGFTTPVAGGTATGSGTGNAGGSATGNAAGGWQGGGGGGAGAVGTSGTITAGGVGGVGLSTASAYGLATGTGENSSGTVYFAGGGGGNAYNQNNFYYGAGGLGGGGSNSAGTVNTGGGAGGGGFLSSTSNGFAGGSGIVIVRYPIYA
jgi:hypothetical protein